ncbi:hypothetical protein ACFZC7_06840 [Streptomyces massasporeus]|uniref:hypothetical protein n=1 Tax=Streptomyces massasporeus TaxID=67324 RepID=UPI0036EC6598
MGDRLSRGGATGRRRGHPGGAAVGPWGPPDDTALHTALAAALLADDPGPEGEHRAVAAFRTARDVGAHGARARTRHRDDWRLPAPGRTGRPVKTTVAAVFTSIALGGVAVAAMGSVGSPANGTDGRTPSSAPASVRPDGSVTRTPSGGPGRGDGPSSAQDVAAQCRAYERVEGRGAALDATAWQRLVAAAGGEDEVDAYCAERRARPPAAPGGSGAPAGTPGGDAVNPGAGTGTAGNKGTTGKGSVGNRHPGGGKGE